jgi:hypothetical protein
MRLAVKRYTVLLEFLIALGILPGCVWSVRTVCVIRRDSTPAERPVEGDEGWWAGRDNAILAEPT